MVVSEIALYNVLKNKLGETEAQTVVEGIKNQVKNTFEDRKDILATKDDLHQLRVELKGDIAELRVDMERGFKDNLKWTIATQFVITGLIIAAIKFL